MRLIDADRFLEYMEEKCDPTTQLDPIILAIVSAALSEQPTAYDIDKVVEELEKATQYIKIDGKPTSVKAIHPTQAIEIVKHGGVNIRKDCEYRHENGNCLKVGGFCTSVNDKHCEKMKHRCVSEDVCEWYVDNKGNYKCKAHAETYDSRVLDWNLCPYCSKKIKVVE